MSSLLRVFSVGFTPHPLSRRIVMLALVVLASFRVIVLVIGVTLHPSVVDPHRFFVIGHHAGRPYSDYPVEYPPALVALVKVLAFATPDEHAFTVAIIVISLLAEAAVAAMLWRNWSREAALLYLTVDTLLLGLFAVRLDLLSVAVVVGALVAALRSRPRVAAICIVLAIGVKLWPLPIALLLVTLVPSAERRKYVVTALVCAAALGAAWLSLGGGSGIEQVVTFRGATGWQIESVVGSFVRLFTHDPALSSAGALRFGRVPAGLAPALQVAALALTVWTMAHARTRRDIGAAWVVSVAGFLVASTLFSPQFVAWLVPAGAIAWASGDALVAAAVAAVVVATVFENSYYAQLAAATPAATALLLVRNTALIVAIAAGAQALRGRTHPTYSAVTARPGRTVRRPVDDAARAPARRNLRRSPRLQRGSRDRHDDAAHPRGAGGERRRALRDRRGG